MKHIFNTICLDLNKLFIAGLLLAPILFCPNIANAQYYEPGVAKPVVIIDKKIGFAGEKSYFDNISSTQKLFVEGDLIVFKIVVQNKSNIVLKNLKVRDTLPNYLVLAFYPGTYSKETNVIETEIAELKPNESMEYVVIARISNIPTSSYSNSRLQQVNTACVTNNVASDCDTAKYFVAFKTMPATGAGDVAVKTVLILSMSATAMLLRKKARGY